MTFVFKPAPCQELRVLAAGLPGLKRTARILGRMRAAIKN